MLHCNRKSENYLLSIKLYIYLIYLVFSKHSNCESKSLTAMLSHCNKKPGLAAPVFFHSLRRFAARLAPVSHWVGICP